MGGKHRRPRAPRRLVVLRVLTAIAVPVFVVVQPTGASSESSHALVAHAAAPAVAPVAVAVTITVPTTPATTPAPTLPIATTTTLYIATTTTVFVAPTTVGRTIIKTRSVTPTTWGSSAAPVALTFDDGPNETYTPQVLDVLARYGVRATFFLVGSEVDRLPALAQRVVSEGHTVGNHTWDHADLTTLDGEGFRAQVDRTEDQLNALVGGMVPCVRPPFGRTNSHVNDELRSRGLTATKWTKDTEDWKRPGADAIVQRALAGAVPGAVILFHDSGPDMSQTVEALPAIIEGIRSRGLRIAPICAVRSV